MTVSSDKNSGNESDNDSEGSLVVLLAFKHGGLQSQEKRAKEEELQRTEIVIAKELLHLPAQE